MAVEVRGARPEDKAAILAISAQVWGGEDYVPNVLDGWLSEGGLAVAELDSHVVGFAKLTLLGPGEVWLEGLRVDPAHRGKGVAKALAQHQFESALALKPRSIRFATAEVNAESLHIAAKQGFREVARFTYVEGPVREEAAPSGVSPVRDVEPAWAFIRASSAYRDARGLLGLGWRFPELTRERLAHLLAQGAVFACGDPPAGILVQAPDPYAPQAFSSLAFLDGDRGAVEALLRSAHAHARDRGQEHLSAMATDDRIEVLARHGLVPLPDFRYVLALEYPIPPR
ncbi:MAG: GNAT family N-acetyltransferase [Candidatus Acetothermia bacterium]|jgi:GNAT superfamily N-acetyltransferase|nr:GNAT family N-acetyltransferase [Candidatus Acetothermia bacterium]